MPLLSISYACIMSCFPLSSWLGIVYERIPKRFQTYFIILHTSSCITTLLWPGDVISTWIAVTLTYLEKHIKPLLPILQGKHSRVSSNVMRMSLISSSIWWHTFPSKKKKIWWHTDSWFGLWDYRISHTPKIDLWDSTCPSDFQKLYLWSQCVPKCDQKRFFVVLIGNRQYSKIRKAKWYHFTYK